MNLFFSGTFHSMILFYIRYYTSIHVGLAWQLHEYTVSACTYLPKCSGCISNTPAGTDPGFSWWGPKPNSSPPRKLILNEWIKLLPCLAFFTSSAHWKSTAKLWLGQYSVCTVVVCQSGSHASCCVLQLPPGRGGGFGEGVGDTHMHQTGRNSCEVLYAKNLYNFFWYISSSKTLPKKLDCCLCNCEAKRDSENCGRKTEKLWNDSWQNDSSAVLAFCFRKPLSMKPVL